MNFQKIKSHAKINIALNINGKSRKFHNIETIIAFVDLHDLIYIKKIKSKNHRISFLGKHSKNIYKNNTVIKLLKILEQKNLLKRNKFEIKIFKRIPTKSGLGGGSMNAASVLKFLINKKIVKTTKNEIYKISKLVGSDVILGLEPTFSILTSKNQIKRFYNHSKIYTLIVKPNFGCSTKTIYAGVKRFEKSQFTNPKKKMLNFKFLKSLNNSLESIAFSKYKKLKKIKFFLSNLSKRSFVRMTGSGSAIVAYFQSKKECEISKRQFDKKFKNCWSIISKTI